MKGRIGTKARRYTIGGEVVQPRNFVFRDAFKFVNHVAKWARGHGGGALGDGRRYIEGRIVGLNLKGMRAPTCVDLWNTGFWIEPPNETGVVNLEAKAGSRFRLSQLQRKIIRMYVLLGREYEITIEVPWCWTIKHPKEVLISGTPENGKWEFRDPRAKGLRGKAAELAVSEWNEHYLANIAKYLRLLRDVGDGEGKSRVDPGPLPILSEAANEYETLGGAKWTQEQLGNIFRRWHLRDTPTKEGGANFELLGISTGGPVAWKGSGVVPYPYPPLENDGAMAPDDIRIHPPRDVEIPWWEIGKYIDAAKYPAKPVFVNEPILLMPTKAYDSPGHKWKWLGTKRHDKYFQMLDDLIGRGVYVTIHDGGADDGSLHGGGMSANWIPGEGVPGGDKPGTIDAMIKEWAGGVSPPPPPEWETMSTWRDFFSEYRAQRRDLV